MLKRNKKSGDDEFVSDKDLDADQLDEYMEDIEE